MSGRGFWKLDDVTNGALEGRLKELIDSGTRTEAHIVAHLAEVDARRLHLLTGHESLFAYCKKALGLSGNEAFYRIVAARMARQFPVLFELLERRRLFISTLPLLRHYITPENHAELLQAVAGKSKAQVLELLAARTPRPDARSYIRKLPVTLRSLPAGPTGTLEPLSPVSYRLQLNTTPALKEKLELARDLLSHANPSGDLAVVIERGLDLLIAGLRKRRLGEHARTTGRDGAAGTSFWEPARRVSSHAATEGDGEQSSHFDRSKSTARTAVEAGAAGSAAPTRRRPSAKSGSACHTQSRPSATPCVSDQEAIDLAESRRERTDRRSHIPAAIRRQVFERDGSRCTFTSANGTRCEARSFLQLDHVLAHACGGADSASNLRVLCAHHNQLHAEQVFGTDHIQEKIQERIQANDSNARRRAS